MTTDASHAPPDGTDLLKTAPTAGDASADTRRQLALRAWRDWPADLPSEIAPPAGTSEAD